MTLTLCCSNHRKTHKSPNQVTQRKKIHKSYCERSFTLELLLFLLNCTHPGRVEIGNITAVLRGVQYTFRCCHNVMNTSLSWCVFTLPPVQWHSEQVHKKLPKRVLDYFSNQVIVSGRGHRFSVFLRCIFWYFEYHMEDAMKPHYTEEKAFDSAASIFKTAQLELIQCRWMSNAT